MLDYLCMWTHTVDLVDDTGKVDEITFILTRARSMQQLYVQAVMACLSLVKEIWEYSSRPEAQCIQGR